MTEEVAADARHLLVVDDDRRLRDLLKRFLLERGYRVTTAVDAEDGLARMNGMAFDMLVVDVMLPNQSGLDFVAQIRRTSQVPVLMLTALGDPSERIRGLEAGADDYLAKPFEPRELLLRIEAILRRSEQAQTGSREIRYGEYVFDPVRGLLSRDGKPLGLTSSEVALLRIFTASPGLTISRAELAERTGTSEGRAIDVQITRLRRKIEADPKNPRFLQTVWGEGYVFWAD
ncbi:response regulator [Marinibaculum pumilum]|uniref:Response regulator n=1 Tax=Marinibaculum pumilum TaxID=1766165 RepID=A0ABV7L5U8_9PROT